MRSIATLSAAFTAAELRRIAAYLQLAQCEVLSTARAAEHRRAADALVTRLDAHASDIADMRARIAAVADTADR
jgi:hypothetical protein